MPEAIPHIVSQHAEEAAFLWLLREAAADQPHYTLAELAELDGRAEAHIDGLRIAGDAGWEMCRGQLAWQEAGEVFAASVLAFESGLEERIDLVLEAATESEEQARGLVGALAWLPFKIAKTHIDRLLSTESSALQRMGLAAAALHRQDPGGLLREAIGHSDAQLRARALRAAGELGRTDLLPTVVRETKGDDETCRFWAAWSSGFLGLPEAGGLLRYLADAGGQFAEAACLIGLRLMRLRESNRWLEELAGKSERRRLAVVGSGVTGDPVRIPWLIEEMSTPEMARIAGEAFTMITGADLVDEGLEGEEPEGFEAGPSEDAQDEDVAMDPDEDLPWPDPTLIEPWWASHHGTFRAGTRYLLGQPVTESSLPDVLRAGMQRQRAAAAQELAIRQPDQPLFEVRARGRRQQLLLGLR
jgi:uncharacterized protein (TIGR02270 family)